MKVLVCISNVPDTTSKINFVENDTKFDTEGVQFIINPNDEFGLTRAIWLQQKQQAEVHVITVGEVSCEPVLRKCLAIGAQKAYRIDCPATDGNAVARELATHCKNESYDLIIAGRESIDYNGGMVGGLLAALLGYDYVTNCIRLDLENSTATLSREIDGGIEHLEAPLPLVIGAQKGLVEEDDLIIPNMRGIMQARQKPLEVLPSANVAATSQIDRFEKPAPKGEVQLVDENNLDTLIELLHNEAKVI